MRLKDSRFRLVVKSDWGEMVVEGCDHVPFDRVLYLSHTLEYRCDLCEAAALDTPPPAVSS